jgi:hypothetical protein
MLRRIVGAAILLFLLGLLVYMVRLNAEAQASPQELTLVTKTRGQEEVKATIVDGEIRFRLKNNHRETITAFAINFGDTSIREDFAYSDVNFGIEPGDTFEKSYPISPSPVGSQIPTLYLLAVLLKNGTADGNAKVSHEIKDERLGEKLQILRTLRVLEKEGVLRGDFKMIKSDLIAALNTDESQTRIELSQLQAVIRRDNNLSDDLMNGLQVGRQKMLQRFGVLEQLPTENREKGFLEFKERANKLLAKL